MAAISVPLHSEPNLFSRLMSRPTSAAGLVVLVLIAAAALLAPWIAPYAPTKLSVANRLHPPALDHLFGTDDLGRDVFSRMLFAARTSLSVALAVVVLSSIVGIVLGLMAGFFKKLDTPVSRLVDAMMAFPDILLAIALVAALGPTAVNVVVALGIVYAPRLARVAAYRGPDRRYGPGHNEK